ncbi:MAG: alpha/beta hydrolase [Polyangiaceae bacterium]|nr:alpha/beta hydrolase [Polyangiaceae bacterium]
MKLAHTFVGDPDAPHLAFLLHGVMGAGHNFRGFIKKLAKERSDYRFVLVDLRYHHDSQGAPGPHTLQSAAEDILELAATLERVPDAVIGHSLGGKVALLMSRLLGQDPPAQFSQNPHSLQQVWVLDSDPGAQAPGSEHQVIQVLRALQKHPGPFAHRADAIAALQKEGLSSGLANWLGTNLGRRPAKLPGASSSATSSSTASSETQAQELFWKLDLPAIEELLHDYFTLDLWPFLEEVVAGDWQNTSVPHLELLYADQSDRWSGSMKERAQQLHRSPYLDVYRLPDSGHWVHVDNPDGLLKILKENLPKRP